MVYFDLSRKDAKTVLNMSLEMHHSPQDQDMREFCDAEHTLLCTQIDKNIFLSVGPWEQRHSIKKLV